MIAVGFIVFVCFLVAVVASRGGDWEWEEPHTWPGWAKVALFPLWVFLFLGTADGDPGPGSPWYEHRRDQERAVLAGQAHISTLAADHQLQFCARYGWPVPPVVARWGEIQRTKGTRAANRYLEEQNRLLAQRRRSA